MELSIEQQRAIALANARARAAQEVPEAAPDSGKPGVIEDSAKGFGSGVLEGAMKFGALPADLAQATIRASAGLADKARQAMGMTPVDPRLMAEIAEPMPGTFAFTKSQIQKVADPFYQPQTTPGEYAKTVGEFAATAPLVQGGLAAKAIQTVVPALASEAAGQMTKGTAFEPVARGVGALAGSFAPSMLSRAVTPFPASPARQAATDTLRREGVGMTAGQATGNKALQYFESEMGGGRAANIVEDQGEQFTRAALRRVGEDATHATPEVVDRALTRIGGQFDDLAARNTANLDPQFGRDLGAAAMRYAEHVPESQRAPVVQNLVADLATLMQQTGRLTGDVYSAFRSRIDSAARGAAADPQLSTALRGVRDSLDDAMERSISGADQAAWREARNQYRNMLVVEKAATGAGENAALGIISPSQLRNATVNQNRRAYARGQGDFADLARSGEAILKPLPNSGTAPRMAAQGIGHLAGIAAGGALGSGFGPGGSAIGAVAGALAPRMVGRLAMTRPAQAYLGNQVLANPGLMADSRRAAVINALIQQRELLNGPSRGSK